MAELKDFARSVAILVSSCDAFFDAWRPFHYFFRKHWPECPFSVYLIVNQLRVRSNTFQIIAVGEDRGWASNMKVALRQLKEPRVLYLQEDYFLNGAVRPDQLAADLDYAFAFSLPAGRLVAHMASIREGSVCFDATLSLERRPWNAGEMRRVLLRYPAMTAAVLVGIHWQALKLWWKGVPVVHRVTGDGVGERAACAAETASQGASVMER